MGVGTAPRERGRGWGRGTDCEGLTSQGSTIERATLWLGGIKVIVKKIGLTQHQI
jgi:hypothetical protein